MTVYFNDDTKVAINGELSLFNGLEDEHDPVLINGRTINPITTQIVRGDFNSQ
jgi:hypothetical protein